MRRRGDIKEKESEHFDGGSYNSSHQWPVSVWKRIVHAPRSDQPFAGGHAALPVITKSTIPAFSRALAMEYVADGIRANTISPGVVDTPLHAHDDLEALKKLHPIPRLVQVSEIVDALFYLQSAPMVNGENIRIDGGAHAGANW